jgi:phosphoheptose isomerase
MLDLVNCELKTKNIIQSKNWKKLETLYKKAKTILFVGNGGNLAIADHAAIDASRLTDKNIIAPGSGVEATSIISDSSFNDWLENWVRIRTKYLNKKDTLVIAFSCSSSGESSQSIINSISFATKKGFATALITAQPKKNLPNKTVQVVQNCQFYHTSEIISLMLTYQLIHQAGFECPSILKKAKMRRFKSLGIKSNVKEKIISYKDVPPSFENEKNNIAIDFDGVIHTFDKGWYDGTCYGKPIKGSLEAIKKIYKKNKIIIFTSKVKPNRPLVNGKTGYELVVNWLKKYKFYKYIQK